MSTTALTELSAIFQIAAALAALWQIRRSGKRLAWGLIATALLVLAGERLWMLLSWLGKGPQARELRTEHELLMLIVSVLLFAGVWLIGGLFQLAREDAARAKESELRLRSILDNAPVGVFTFDTDLTVTGCNPRLAGILGIECEQLVGFDLNTLPDRRIVEALRETLEGQRREGTGPFRSTLSGRELFGMLVTIPQLGADGRVAGGIGFVVDLSQLQKVEAEARRLALLVERSPEAIFTTDHDGVITYANPAMCRLTGFSRTELVGARRNVLYGQDELSETHREMWAAVRSGHTWEGTLKKRRKDGTAFQVESLVFPLLGKDGERLGFATFSRDITERRRLEERMRQMEKMETVGQLAGGIAHDFNNALTAIVTTVDMLRLHRAGVDLERSLNVIGDACEHAANLTRQLLAFSRNQVLQPVDLDLNAIVEANLDMLQRLIGEHIVIDYLPAQHLGTVHADPGQLTQVLMNLCANARDAMPKGGTITIETGSVVVNDEFVASHPWTAPGTFVLLTVSDTGEGMDEVTLKRVFEPFFTTKAPGSGTGLGLASVFGIVKQHEGFIHAYSEPGHGTTFQIYLPVVERRATEIVETPTGPLRGGSETILLVEDDPGVRAALAAGLANQGYHVLTAEDGEVALKVLEENGWNVDLLLSDTIMPRMGGMELLRAVAQRAPGIPCILLSGYARDAAVEGGVLPPR
ncbi:MAG: PAS domain S-box protein, partial [Acidobacteria bacterium]|nr:PAS domain S-box protein [Acidobacteriota bacterium]